ncbi:META domain-containing protein [Novosphingobium sp. KN65.2]|uniref:META domain-containing protein n=1 Tax=Novosphingobium sp. KN65.2 TaxID=1478134 RepID=UPI0005E57B34|nr:META domain-containing protein [Novosphingobium sp. KN65.2]CDO35704.1 exported hypothetical protein [Novosphingobium sp. KN65.2]
MPARISIAASMAACTLASCAPVSMPDADAGNVLAGTSWRLVSIDRGNAGRAALTSALQARHTLSFNRDGSLSLTLDCNRGNANWSAGPLQSGNGSLTIGPVAATRALCPAPSFGEEMAAALPAAKGFTLLPGGKGLTIMTGTAVFAFVAGSSGPPSPQPTTLPGTEDALVPGTDYHATAQVPCGMAGKPPNSRCFAGVKRHWGPDGTHLVEVTRPDGRKRAIFFRGTTPYGADSAEADGSAGWQFTVTRNGDRNTIQFGPESYVIVDALVEGG